jgi:hypothetical protein
MTIYPKGGNCRVRKLSILGLRGFEVRFTHGGLCVVSQCALKLSKVAIISNESDTSFLQETIKLLDNFI